VLRYSGVPIGSLAMASEWWTPVATMVGVVVGGGLTYATQRTTLRAAERTDERNRRTAVAEARRSEQIQALMDFVRYAQEAEGVAHARPESWDRGDEWYRTARPAVDGLRMARQRIDLVCPASTREPAQTYEHALNQVVWRDHGDQVVADRLQPAKERFIATARDSLGADEPT
jgi:hypothetical protein